MKKYLLELKKLGYHFSQEELEKPFDELGLESFDLLNIRTSLEKKLGLPIVDSTWLQFKSVFDVVLFCDFHDSQEKYFPKTKKTQLFSKQISIEMPQMALGAMSENWFLKEIGSIHWQMLCEGLKTKSSELKDEENQRLYATFVRIKVEYGLPLNQFKENENLKFKAKIKRFGESLYYSEIKSKAGNTEIKAKMMSSFSVRNANDNSQLLKSKPFSKINKIEELFENDKFGEDYLAIKKQIKHFLKLDKYKFLLNRKVVFEANYRLNPYYDMNGVGLLYFAAYPIISDFCEAQYFNQSFENEVRWEENYSTLSRDIFYYGNCNINDEIIYKLHEFSFDDDGKVMLLSALHRKSDEKKIAQIFTIKSNQK